MNGLEKLIKKLEERPSEEALQTAITTLRNLREAAEEDHCVDASDIESFLDMALI